MASIVAAHWPAIGEVIPQAVQDVQGEAPFIYPYRWVYGDRMVAGMGTVEYTLKQQVIAGAITVEQALESAQNSGLTTGPGAFQTVAIG